jgi:hypothetical protein
MRTLKKICYLLFMSFLLIAGCTDNKESDLVGTWQEINNPKGKLVFRSDHTGLAYWPDQAGNQEASEMKWQLLKGGSKVSVITPPGPVDFEIKPDRLIAPNGVILHRVK